MSFLSIIVCTFIYLFSCGNTISNSQPDVVVPNIVLKDLPIEKISTTEINIELDSKVLDRFYSEEFPVTEYEYAFQEIAKIVAKLLKVIDEDQESNKEYINTLNLISEAIPILINTLKRVLKENNTEAQKGIGKGIRHIAKDLNHIMKIIALSIISERLGIIEPLQSSITETSGEIEDKPVVK